MFLPVVPTTMVIMSTLLRCSFDMHCVRVGPPKQSLSPRFPIHRSHDIPPNGKLKLLMTPDCMTANDCMCPGPEDDCSNSLENNADGLNSLENNADWFEA